MGDPARAELWQSVNMEFIDSQFSEKWDQGPGGPARMTVLLAATPSCGADTIADAIRSTGQLGLPFDYTEPAHLARWAGVFDTATPEATLTSLSQRRRTENGVFSLVAKFDHGVTFTTTQAMLQLLPDVRPVHIRRVDVLRQAVCFALTKQTEIWDGDGSDPPRYDPGLIDHCLNDIVVQNALWTRLFDRLGLTPLELTFEDAAQGLPLMLERIGRFCDLPDIPPAELAPKESPEPDPRIEDWVTRYADDRLARKAILQELDDLARGDWRQHGAPD